MPTIKLQDDPAVYTVEVKSKGTVAIDVLELKAKLVERGADLSGDLDPAQIEHITEATRAVMFTPNGGGPVAVTDTELCALGWKCLEHFANLGNVPGGPQTSQPPTA